VSRVLVVEDDGDIALGLRVVLGQAGYEVAEAGDGRSAMRVFHDVRPDLVVLDVGLPELDGWDVLERIRDQSDTPILMLSARGQEADKVRGLRGGADDYLTKPFGATELVARIQALLRRLPREATQSEVYDDGVLRLDPSTREADVGGRPVHLTSTEFRLLAALVRNPGQVLTPQQLLARAWDDPSGVGPERVKYVVRRLRRKIGWDDAGPLVSVRSVGYRYRPPG
jgi:DNA-binding response OmpR family regulator